MNNQRMRSPSYPSIGLEKALNDTHKIHASYGTVSLEREVIAKCLGFSSLSGPALARLATLKSYGLLKKTAKAESAVSELGMQSLFDPSDGERVEAIQKAFFAPPCFEQIFTKYGPLVTNAEGIESFLCLNGFSQKAASHTAKVYLDSLEFVALGKESDRNDLTLDLCQNAPNVSTDDTPMTNQMPTRFSDFQEVVRADLSAQKSFRLMIRGGSLATKEWDVLFNILQIQKSCRDATQPPQDQEGIGNS